MKKNNGVSLITLIITICVIIILAAITIFYGLTKNADEAENVRNIDDVMSLTDAVTNRVLMHRVNPSYYRYVGTPLSGEGYTVNGVTYSGEDWYIIETAEELNELGVSGITGVFLVNYVSNEVISVEGISYNGKKYYLLSELRSEIGGGTFMLAHVEFDEAKKVNKPVLSNGMVPVKLSGGSWVVTDTSDDEWYDYSKDQSAWANVMLKDELEVTDKSNEEVRKASISDLKGKAVTKEGSMYVWLPRYTTSNFGGSGSKIIFSNLTKDTTSYNGETYVLPENVFTYTSTDGGSEQSLELPGIWVSKYEAGF